MKHFAVYLAATGRVVRCLTNPAGDVDSSWFAPEESFVEVPERFEDWEAYWATGSPVAIEPRPANPATLDVTNILANGTAVATISGIEVGAAMTVTDGNGTTVYTITDTELELTADEPGAITVRVRGIFPSLDKQFTVTAT